MKKALLGIFGIALCFPLMAQEPVQETVNYIESNEVFSFDRRNKEQAAKKDVVSTWYSYVDALREVAGATFTRISNATLFPDSTVKQIYGSDGGGTELGYTGLHSVGQTFDPKSFVFLDESLTRHNPYTVDSIAFAYQYFYNRPGTVDTLIIQFLDDTKVDTGRLQGGGVWAGAAYSPALNRSPNFTREIKLPIGVNDSSANLTVRSIAVPGGPMSVRGGGVSAVTITFKPGYSYNTGDTLIHDWMPEPVNKLNHFIIYNPRTSDKGIDVSRNMSMRANKGSKYGGSNWPNRYIPGTAWLDFDDHIYVQFHITSLNVGVKDNNFSGYNLGKAYPNPATVSQDVNIDFTIANREKVEIELHNLLGQKVMTITNDDFNAGTHTVRFSTSELESGLYFYTMKAGGFSKAYKLNLSK